MNFLLQIAGGAFRVLLVFLFTLAVAHTARAARDGAPAGFDFTWAAIVPTVVINKSNYKSWTITALDADTTIAFAHGFKSNAGADVAPDMAMLQMLVSYASAALPNWGVSVSATQITLNKTNAAASGGAVPGTTVIAKLWALRPQSLVE